MTRTLPATITNDVLESDEGILVRGRLTVYNNRVFSDTIITDYGTWCAHPVYTRNIDPQTNLDTNAWLLRNPNAQACCYDEVSDKVWTVFVESGMIYLMYEGANNPCYLVDPTGTQLLNSYNACRPSILPGLVYFIDFGGNLVKASFNFADAIGNTSINAVSVEIISSDSHYGAVYALDSSTIVRVYNDDGGVRAAVYNTSGTHTWPYRFIWPDQGWSGSVNDVSPTEATQVYHTNYSAAVKDSNGNIFVYITDPYGQVMGVKYSEINSEDSWSDPFLAVPADVSIFYIANAALDPQGHIHLVGQFMRTSEYTGEFIHNLDLWSIDGQTFSIDRWTSVSTSGYRLQAVLRGTSITFTDMNRYFTGNAPFSWLGKETDHVSIPAENIKTVSGNDSGINNSDMTMNLASGDYSYRSNPYLNSKGNVGVLEIGVVGSDGKMVYFDYHIGIISKFQAVDRGNFHGASVTLTLDGIYRLSRMTHPFYLEMLAKEAFFSTIETGDFTSAPFNGALSEPLNLSMWGDQTLWDGGGLGSLSHGANAHKDVLSTDIEAYLSLVDYPSIPSNQGSITLSMYAWSRIGLPDSNPNVADPTPMTNPNDTVQPIFVIRRGTEAQDRTFVIDLSHSVNPQLEYTYGSGTFTGVCPVVYTIPVGTDSLMSGDIIKQIGFRFASTSPTVFYPERVESLDIMVYKQELSPEWTHSSSPSQKSLYQFSSTIDPWVIDHDQTDNPGAYSLVHATSVGWYGDGCLNIAFSGDDGDHGPTTHAYASLALDGSTAVAGQVFDGWIFGWNTFGTLKAIVVYADNSTDEFAITSSGGSNWFKFTVVVSSQNAGKALAYLKVGLFMNGDPNFVPLFSIFVDYVTLLGQYQNATVSALANTINTNTLTKKGIPSVVFCNVPNTAFNFKVCGKFSINGGNSWAGLVGFGKDALNFYVGRISLSKIQICSYVYGKCNILASVDHSGVDGETVEFMFYHRDGVFGVCLKTDNIWQYPALTYTASLAGGGIPYLHGVTSGAVITSTSDTAVADFYHVGYYGYIDSYKFRTTGFDVKAGNVLAVLPGADLDNDFAHFVSDAPGKIEIDDVIYTYDGAVSAIVSRGPFQVRSEMNWSFKNPSDGEAYSGPSTDITWFKWLNDAVHHGDFAGKIIGVNNSRAHIIGDTAWRCYITTGGNWVHQMDRSRWYSSTMDPNTDDPSCSQRAYVTYGLTGVKLVSTPTDDFTQYHTEGAIVNLVEYTTENVIIEGFSATNGERESTVKDMLKKIAALAGARASFRGDKKIASLPLSSSPTQIWSEQ